MDFFRDHLLSIITYTPLVGALLLLLPAVRAATTTRCAGRQRLRPSSASWSACRCGSGSTAGADGFQFVEQHAWIPAIGVQYFFGVDGISVLLILLTTLLGFIAILSLLDRDPERVRHTTSSCCCCRPG